jgi:hypothetical protein
MVTARLPLGFHLEFDALYRRVGYRYSDSDIIGDFFSVRQRGNSWEFPILVRRSFWRGVYAGVGYVPRIINGHGHQDAITLENPYTLPQVWRYTESDVPGQWQTTHGVLGVAGIEKRAGPLHIAPEVRYTYWTQPALQYYGSHGFTLLSSQHQVDLLVGITFP